MTVNQMVNWLDREEIAEARMRRFRNRIRRMPPALRKFALVLRRVVEDVPGPENLQRKKIMEALKIKDARYYNLRKKVEKYLP